MSKDNNRGKFTRRSFIKGVGTGVIGSYAVTPGLENITKKIEEKSADILAGKQPLGITVNGKKYSLMVTPQTTLAEVLRDELELTGTKIVCNHGECGGCTVLLNGKAVYSCHMLAFDAAGKEVTTIEGLMTGEKLHPVQEAFVEHDGLQCGFCTPGQIMAAQAIIINNPKPSREEILKGMSGNLCRCAAYPNILESAIAAAEANK